MRPNRAIFLLPFFTLLLPAADRVPTAKPEDVGLSTERLQRVHETIQRHIDTKEISGAVTLVARNGRVVHFEAHGLMDLESKKPMAKDAIFRLASMTKPITAVAVLMLVEQGRIRMNDLVSRFIPTFKNTKVATAGGGGMGGPREIAMVPANREITIHDCLTHTSGLDSGGPGGPETARLAPWTTTNTLATRIPLLGLVPLDFQPGTQWAYSGNGGPDVLARIVEIVTGLPYDEYLRTRLFEPLAMKDSYLNVPDEKLARIPTLYNRAGLQRQANQWTAKTPYISASSGLLSTAEDYLHFSQMLLNGGTFNGKRILGPQSVKLMASNQVGDLYSGKLGRPAHGMGFGFLVEIVHDPKAAGRAVSDGSFGWDGAYGTECWTDPKEQMVWMLLIQERVVQVQRDFEAAVSQAIVR
jgi:CubicO group peptidase (beta-lactamase class C family)